MALDKNTLIEDIKAIQDDLKDRTDYETARNRFAQKLADAVEKYVKSATVTVESGIAVSTTGSATAQTGKTTEIGTGSIS